MNKQPAVKWIVLDEWTEKVWIQPLLNSHITSLQKGEFFIRVGTISQVIVKSIKKELVASYFDDWLSVLVIFQVKMSNHCWFQPLKLKGLLLFFVINDGKWPYEEWVFVSSTVRLTNKAIWRPHIGLWEPEQNFSNKIKLNLLILKIMKRLIKRENSH